MTFYFSCFFPNRRYFLRVLIWVQRGDYTETDTKREPILSSAGRRSQKPFSFRSDFSIKTKIYFVFYIFEKFSSGKTTVFFPLFCVFCIFAQGFSLKTQLVEQNTNKMNINSMFSGSKTPTTQQNKCFFNICERKHMYQSIAPKCEYTQ